jgi:hypothetical protein
MGRLGASGGKKLQVAGKPSSGAPKEANMTAPSDGESESKTAPSEVGRTDLILQKLEQNSWSYSQVDEADNNEDEAAPMIARDPLSSASIQVEKPTPGRRREHTYRFEVERSAAFITPQGPPLPPDGATVADMVHHVQSTFYGQILVATAMAWMSDGLQVGLTILMALSTSSWNGTILISSFFACQLVGFGVSYIFWIETWGYRRVFCILSALRPVAGAGMLLDLSNTNTILVLTFLVGFLSSNRLLAHSILTEWTSPFRRKHVGIVMTAAWSLGLLLVAVTYALMNETLYTTIWVVQTIVGVCSLISIHLLPQSPSWLIRQDQCEQALLLLGEHSGPQFDWLVALHTNPTLSIGSAFYIIKSYQHQLFLSKFFGWGVLYFGSLCYPGDTGTIAAGAEFELLGVILAAFFCQSDWTQLASFLVGGLSSTCLAALPHGSTPFLSAVLSLTSRASLMASATLIFMEIDTTLLSTSMTLVGGMQVPISLAMGPAGVAFLALETFVCSYACWKQVPAERRRRLYLKANELIKDNEAVTAFL